MQLVAKVGVALSVQVVHPSDVRGLLEDLADPSQPRFGELAHMKHSRTGVGPTTPSRCRGARSQARLCTLYHRQHRAHIEESVSANCARAQHWDMPDYQQLHTP